uniref:Uncharacterized protein n=1 Tax=Solanum tuberosum TaxID=4113 RepID=M1DED3_SOLTU
MSRWDPVQKSDFGSRFKCRIPIQVLDLRSGSGLVSVSCLGLYVGVKSSLNVRGFGSGVRVSLESGLGVEFHIVRRGRVPV